ncbi:MAG: hypothetical protein R3E87_19875 [Burkholderiaceae bacterium]
MADIERALWPSRTASPVTTFAQRPNAGCGNALSLQQLVDEFLAEDDDIDRFTGNDAIEHAAHLAPKSPSIPKTGGPREVGGDGGDESVGGASAEDLDGVHAGSGCGVLASLLSRGLDEHHW